MPKSFAAHAGASFPRPMPTRALALKLAGIYALVAGLWILGSSWLLLQLVPNRSLMAILETGKGWLFVGLTSLLLSWALDKYFRQIRRSHQLLQASEQRWLFALDGAGDGVWDWDAQTDQVFYSDQWKAMLGYAPHEIGAGLTEWESRVHPDDLAQVRSELQKHLDGGTVSYRSEHRLLCKDGRYKWILDRGKVMSRTPDGRPLRVIGTHTDISSRKQAEGALRESESRFRALFETMGEGVALHELLCDAEGRAVDYRILDVNPAYERQTGLTADRVRGQTARTVYGVETAPYLEVFAKVALAGQSASFETCFAPMGKHFSISAFSPKPGWFATVFTDITERKRNEEALAAEAVRRRILVDQSSDGIVVLGEDGRVVEANHGFARMLGYSAAEAAKLHVWDWDMQWDREALLEIIQSIDSQGRHFATCHRRKDGTIIDVEVTANGATLDGRKLVFCVLRDVSKRKQAESALKESEERFRMVVETAPEAIFIRAGDCFKYVNTAAVKLFGASSAEELLGTKVMDRFHPEFRAEILRRMQCLDGKGERATSANQIFLRLDGSPAHVVVSAVPFQFQGEQAALVFAQDVSEEKYLESQLRQAQKMEAIGMLAGGVAHDFNNILAAVMMHLGLMKQRAKIDKETEFGLNELEAAAQRAACLTRQLLMFGRRSVLAIKPVNLNDVVASLLKMLTRLIGEQIDLRFDSQSALPLVSADAGMMDQVLMNLVVNARDAMPNGGRIGIRTFTTQFEVDQLQANHERKAGSFVCLAVSDTGCGMDEATLKRIFEPFFTTKEAGQGTGLGLATVHGIVAQHGGWIEVHSAQGRGSTFSIFLPALSVTEIAEPRSLAAEPVQRGHETIFLVEDDAPVRAVIGQSLRVLGYRVHEASNGREAMTMWQTLGSQVDLLLTDMVMPGGMTGLELAEQLRMQRPGLKVIVSSGYSAEIAHAGVPTRAGVVYLPKPYQMEFLARLLRECLDPKL